MRGTTNAVPAGGGLKVIAEGIETTSAGKAEITLPAPFKVLLISYYISGGDWTAFEAYWAFIGSVVGEHGTVSASKDSKTFYLSTDYIQFQYTALG